MPKKTKMLQDLFHDTLKDVYFAEKKILTTLPKMKKAAQSEELAALSKSTTVRPRAMSSVSNKSSRSSARSHTPKHATPYWELFVMLDGLCRG